MIQKQREITIATTRKSRAWYRLGRLSPIAADTVASPMAIIVPRPEVALAAEPSSPDSQWAPDGALAIASCSEPAPSFAGSSQSVAETSQTINQHERAAR